MDPAPIVHELCKIAVDLSYSAQSSDLQVADNIGFMIGRFSGSAVMKRIAPSKLLGIFAVCALLCTLTAVVGSGATPVGAVVLLGFFDSIMFPTIFALSVKNLGAYTKLGSALLVMSIIGGAIVPAAMGYISDVSSIQKAFVVPLICYAYVFYFALRGSRPVVAATGLEA
jgi:FHS family L-fucose permease-like MFS transporter